MPKVGSFCALCLLQPLFPETSKFNNSIICSPCAPALTQVGLAQLALLAQLGQLAQLAQLAQAKVILKRANKILSGCVRSVPAKKKVKIKFILKMR